MQKFHTDASGTITEMQCRQCLQWKLPFQFHEARGTRTGRAGTCKLCRRDQIKARRDAINAHMDKLRAEQGLPSRAEMASINKSLAAQHREQRRKAFNPFETPGQLTFPSPTPKKRGRPKRIEGWDPKGVANPEPTLVHQETREEIAPSFTSLFNLPTKEGE